MVKRISLLTIFMTLCCMVTAMAATSRGDSGTSVEKVQQLLITQGYLMDKADGFFGNNTEYSVRAFQKEHNLPVTGSVDNQTLAALEKNNQLFVQSKASGLTRGSSGTQVSHVQQLLVTQGYLMDKADGFFGNNTEYSVRAFQKDQGLPVTGAVDNRTLQAMEVNNKKFTKAVTKSAPTGTGRGASGQKVTEVQQLLINQGYLMDKADGVFGNNTEYSVRVFQKEHSLPVTGMVDNTTLQKMQENNKKFVRASQQSRNIRNAEVSRYGDRGRQVEDLQMRLENSGFSPGAIDGIFGEGTISALKRFQAHYGLSQTGSLDAATQAKLGNHKGIPTSYDRVLHMDASAYTAYDAGNSHYTARGNYLRKGYVSVDPDVIPLGTKLYIPGYGYAIADDIGGAIQGNRIDLAMDTQDEAFQFGRRNIKVYVL